MIHDIVDELSWSICLALTLLVEVGIFLVWSWWGRASFQSLATGPSILALVGLNLVSHPMAWQALTIGVPWFVCELMVAGLEAVGLASIVPGLGWWDAVRLSLWCNATSASIGVGIVVWGNSLLLHDMKTRYAFLVDVPSVLI